MGAHRYPLPLALIAAGAAAAVATLLLRPRGSALDPAVVDPTAYFSAAQLERASDFRGPQRIIGFAELAVAGVTLAILAVRPPRRMARAHDRHGDHPLAGAGAAGAGIVLVLALATLPLALVAHLRATDVGLSTQEVPGWLLDAGKATGVGAVEGALGAVLLIVLIRRFPRNWWAPAGIAVILTGVLLTYAAPVVLRPLFNEFTPLPKGSLRSEVLELAGRSGVEVGEVYRVDASRRTTAANAYVDGLGPTKRVVLYDNLVDELPPDQVRAVVAHELAHVEQRDILRGLAWLAIVALPGMLAVQRLSEAILVRRRGAALPASPAALPAIALSLALVSFVAQLPANSLSRMVESRADARALALTLEPDAFVDLQRDLAVRNIAEPDPPAVLHDLLGTHPTTLERIGLGRAWARERSVRR